MLGAFPHAAFAAAVLLAAASVPPVAAAPTLPAISFRVVQPDGTALRSPIVMVSILGAEYRVPTASVGSATGVVTVAVPADDPVVEDRLAADEAVNVLIRVFDKKPGSEDIKAVYVTAAIGKGAMDHVHELSDVHGRTFTVEPGRTAFFPVAATDLPRREDLFGEHASDEDEPDCPHYGGGTPVPCHIVDYPEWSRNTLIPIADNHGAGADVMSSISYNSTHVTTSSIAIEAGGVGFVKGEGAVAFEKENTISLGWVPRGKGENREALLDTEMVRTRSGACYLDFPSTTTWQCQIETTYRPNQAKGTHSEAHWGADHDSMEKEFDCWAWLDAHYGNAKGEAKRLTYSLQLGPSEEWAVDQGSLYANTTVTSQTNTKKGHVRSWNVDHATAAYPYHYLYVPNGMANFDRAKMGGGPGACVETAAPEIESHASHTDMSKTAVAVEEMPPTPDPEGPGRTVCGRMPDKCD